MSGHASDAEVEHLVRAFESCTLPGERWTHPAHLTVALWYLLHYPRAEAMRRIRDGIRRYNKSRGNHTGYHETITRAWVAVVARFLAARDPDDGVGRLAAGLIEACGTSNHLLRYYSREVLFSDAARRGWVPPDLQPIEPPGALA